MGETEYKISQYADDTCLTILANKKNMQKKITVFDKFEKYSGLKVNYHKTEIMPVGSFKKLSIHDTDN